MTLDEKIQRAESVIRAVLERYKAPALWCSFGKDSMVLLHLLRRLGVNLPLVFYTDPWFPKKYAFAHEIIAEWDLEVHDYAPFAVTLWEGVEIMAFTNHYQIGHNTAAPLHLPKNILPPEPGKKWICGLNDLLRRPTGTFTYPFDVALVGHKSSDQDQIAGKIPLHCDIKQNAGHCTDAAFPLREWSDSDVWEYTERFQVPVQGDRYDVASRCELPDKHANSDYAHVCIACIDRREKATSVLCPKSGLEVSNVSSVVPYIVPQHDYYGHADN